MKFIGAAATLFLLVLTLVVSGSQPGSNQLDGLAIFRFDTFGDEQLWTKTLGMHEVIQSSVSPETALGVGLKVDVEALPEALRAALQAEQVDLTDPAVTVELLRLNAVVGVMGKVDGGNLTSVGWRRNSRHCWSTN